MGKNWAISQPNESFQTQFGTRNFPEWRFFTFCSNLPLSRLVGAFLWRGLHCHFSVSKYSVCFKAILWWQLCISVDSWFFYTRPLFIKVSLSSHYINVEITVIACWNSWRSRSIYVKHYLHLLPFAPNWWCCLTIAICVTAQAAQHYRRTSSPSVVLAFVAASLLRSMGRSVEHRQPQINSPFSLGMMGRLMGPVRADRLTCFPSPFVPTAISQTEVPSEQEFHTLLKMWLLSAAAGAPINRGSSFLPSPPRFSLCLSEHYVNPSRGFWHVCCQKKRQDPNFNIEDQWLIRDFFT